MKSLLIGTGHKLQHSVNYYNSRAHGYERSRLLTGLVGCGIVLVSCVWLVNRTR
jgi:hypothetical protein